MTKNTLEKLELLKFKRALSKSRSIGFDMVAMLFIAEHDVRSRIRKKIAQHK